MVSLALVALGLVIALFIVFVSIMNNAISKSGGSLDRRQFLQGIVTVSVGAYVAGTIGPTAIDELFSEADILRIVSGGLYSIESGDTETYSTVIWESDATLCMEPDSTLGVKP